MAKNDTTVLKFRSQVKTYKGEQQVQYVTSVMIGGRNFVISINQSKDGIAFPQKDESGKPVPGKFVIYGRMTEFNNSSSTFQKGAMKKTYNVF